MPPTTSTDEPVDTPQHKTRGFTIALGAILGLLAVGALAFFLGRETPREVTLEVQIVEPRLADLTTLDRVVCPTTSPAASPLPNSYFRTESGRIDGSLYASGQIVAWNIATSATETQDNPLVFDVEFNDSTDGDTGIVCAFVSTDDPYATDTDGDVSTTANWSPDRAEDNLAGELTIEGLNKGQTSVIQLWTVIDPASGQQPNLRVRMNPQIGTDANAASASVRASFKQPVEPTDGTLELTITDGDTEQNAGGTFTAQWTVENTTDDRVFDFVDLVGAFEGDAEMTGVEIVGDTDGSPSSCALADNGFLCNMGFMKPGEKVDVQATAKIDRLAESFYTGAAGTCDDGFQDLCSTGTLGFLGQFNRNELDISESADIRGDGTLSAAVISDPEIGYVNRPLTLSVVLTSAVDGVEIDDIELTGCADDELELASGDLDADDLLDRSEVWEFACLSRLATEDGELIVRGRTSTSGPAQLKTDFSVELISPGIRLIRETVEDSARFTLVNLGDVTLNELAVIAEDCVPEYTEGDEDGDGELDPEEEWILWCQATAGEGRVFAVDTQGGVVTATEVLAEDL